MCRVRNWDIFSQTIKNTADFWEFLSTTIEVWLLDGQLMTCHQFQAFQGFSWNFLIFHDPRSSVVWKLLSQLVHSPFSDSNLFSIHLWWMEIALKIKNLNLENQDFENVSFLNRNYLNKYVSFHYLLTYLFLLLTLETSIIKMCHKCDKCVNLK